MPLFCRHNRLIANCPICSRERQAEARANAPARAPRARSAAAGAARGSSGRGRGVVTRKLHRAADDGYRNPLVPGLRATADAERLAAALAAAAARLAHPGPYPALAEEPDLEQATWLAFLLALAGPDAPELQAAVLAARPPWADGADPGLPADRARTVEAYRAWVARWESQAAAITGETAWDAQRRFARIFERLALPGFTRARRFEFLSALGAARRFDLEAGALQVGAGQDPTTDAAKRILVSGDTLLLERRARELAEACAVPLAALDRAFAVWGAPGDHAELAAEPPAPMRSALALR